jgi:hypothetical protein
MQKSTRNGKNNAKIRALAIWPFSVYHGQINHEEALTELYVALTGGGGREGPSSSPSPRKHALACLHPLLPHPQADADGEKGRLNYPLRLGLGTYPSPPAGEGLG